MIKRKLIFTFLCPAVIVAAGAGLTMGYYKNLEANQYNPYKQSPASANSPDLIQSYFAATVNGAELLYLASFAHTKAMTIGLDTPKTLNKPLYDAFSKTGFVLIDDVYGLPIFDGNGNLTSDSQPIWSTNAASIQFRPDLGTFITGIASAQFLNENKAYFLGQSNRNFKWATYGGSDTPSVTSFLAGMQKGMDWFNTNFFNDDTPLVTDYRKMQHVAPTNQSNSHFVNSYEPTGGNVLITSLLDLDNKEGLDLLMPVAGPQTQQAVRLIKQRQNARTIIVGVDSPMEEDTSANLGLNGLTAGQKVGNNNIIQFSSIKNIQSILGKVTEQINKGATTPENNGVGGLGYITIADVNNDGVGVSEAGKPYFIKAMKLFAKSLNVDFSSWTESDALDNKQKTNVNDADKQGILNETYDASKISNEYSKAIKMLASLQAFKDLEKPENKIYSYNGNQITQYKDLRNKSVRMTPITNINDLENWYVEAYGTSNNRSKQNSINSLKQWINKHQNEINERKKLDLKDHFTKERYDKNKGIIKIILQSSSSLLFDKSFYEATYNALKNYWQTKGVTLPNPPNQQK